MFTGIVQGLCPVVAIEDVDGIRRFTVDLGPLADGVKHGASIANNGTCLSATAMDGGLVTFDVIGETLTVTNLGDVSVGDSVNIERSMAFGDEIGGHIVSGHVSTTATVSEIETDGQNRTVWFTTEAEAMPYLLMKGFTALDGASLTISRVDRPTNRFAVSLIPDTIEKTTLGRVVVGDRVNVEFDSQTQAIVDTVRDVLTDQTLRDQILGTEQP
ncbi:MAG: riboflavin synthase subunit alpha [Actinomycetota bacterium]